MSSIINNLKYLKESNKLIQQAIINKGVLVEDKDTFRSYAKYIESIPAADGDTRLYKECLDNIYLACIGRGLQVDKNHPETFAENISKLRKIDLNFIFSEDMNSIANIDLNNNDIISIDFKLEDSMTANIYDPKVSNISDDISSLKDITINITNNIMEVNI